MRAPGERREAAMALVQPEQPDRHLGKKPEGGQMHHQTRISSATAPGEIRGTDESPCPQAPPHLMVLKLLQQTSPSSLQGVNGRRDSPHHPA